LPVDGMNCHSPEALARENALGVNALSITGSSAISVGMLRFSTCSTM
jgi:hypothetical protein